MSTLVKKCNSVVPDIIARAAQKEGIDGKELALAVAKGRAVVPANPAREHDPIAIGEDCTVKVNVNIGTSGTRCDPDYEYRKAECAVSEGADAIMDLSTGGDLKEIRKKILSLNATTGTVPIYEAVKRAGNALDVTPDLLFSIIREHCKEGVDFLTLHCGVNKESFESLKKDPRVTGVVSRGGAFHTAIIASTGEENPLYSEYDYLLEILAENETIISLGDGMRPGAVIDAGRRAKATEYLTLGDLSQRALEGGVQRMIEGPGHIPIDQIDYNVRFIKEVTGNAPLYLLGPLVTDIFPGYDHVSGAIGGSIAAMSGADFLCMVSPSEHLALPDLDDIREGTRVAKLAAHVGDRGRKGQKWFNKGETGMAFARRNLDWNAQFSHAVYGDYARSIHERDGEIETCSMCGELCAIKILKELLENRN